MPLTAINPLTVLVCPERDLTWPHLNPNAIHCCHKPAADDGHNPLRHWVFMPLIDHARHQRQEHHTGDIIAGPGLLDIRDSLEERDQSEIIEPFLGLMTHSLRITPDMPDRTSRLDCGDHGKTTGTEPV